MIVDIYIYLFNNNNTFTHLHTPKYTQDIIYKKVKLRERLKMGGVKMKIVS